LSSRFANVGIEELLSADVQNLNLDDIVTFTEKIVGLQIPRPPSDFLSFEELKIYICPSGLTLGQVVYPPGFSFECQMIIFGHHADVSASELRINLRSSPANSIA